jgi:hypothetical protein
MTSANCSQTVVFLDQITPHLTDSRCRYLFPLFRMFASCLNKLKLKRSEITLPPDATRYSVFSGPIWSERESFLKLWSTVKTSNFGPHANFELFFLEGLALSKRVLRKNEESENCRKTWNLQIRFCRFLVHISSKEATELPRKGATFSWRPWCPKF